MELLLWLNPAKRNPAGTLPLSLRITINGVRAEKATGLRATPKEWDQTRQKLRGDSKAVRLLNNSLDTLKARATVNKDSLVAAYEADLQAGKYSAQPPTARQVADSLRPVKATKALGLFDELEAVRVAHYGAGNVTTFQNMAWGLKCWQRWRNQVHQGIDLPLSDVSTVVAKQFAGFLRPLSPNTRLVYLCQLDSLYLKARPGMRSPFAGLAATGEAPEVLRPRIPLTAEQLARLEAQELDPHSVQGLARAVFLVSYYLHGIRLQNVLTLRACDYKEGRVAVAAMKRGKAKNLRVPAAAAALFAAYPVGPQRPATAPLLPVLPADYFQQPPAERLRMKKAAATRLNRALGRLAKRVGVERLHVHLARHTLANAAHAATGDTWTVKEMLGHKNIAHTEIYLQSMSTAQQDAAGDLIYGK